VSIVEGAIRVVLSGTMPGDEIWASGFWLVGAATQDTDAMIDLAADITDSMAYAGSASAMSRVASNLWSAETSWNLTTCYQYNDGTAHASVMGSFELATPLSGSAGYHLPNQCAVVISLRTNFPSRRARGRMFMPCTGAQLDGGGQLLEAEPGAEALAWASNIENLNTLLPEAVVSVVSTVGSSAQQVTSVVVKSRLDVMRSRANRQVFETVASHPVATS